MVGGIFEVVEVAEFTANHVVVVENVLVVVTVVVGGGGTKIASQVIFTDCPEPNEKRNSNTL